MNNDTGKYTKVKKANKPKQEARTLIFVFAPRHSYCLVFQTATSTLINLVKDQINFNESRIDIFAIDKLHKLFKKTSRASNCRSKKVSNAGVLHLSVSRMIAFKGVKGLSDKRHTFKLFYQRIACVFFFILIYRHVPERWITVS